MHSKKLVAVVWVLACLSVSGCGKASAQGENRGDARNVNAQGEANGYWLLSTNVEGALFLDSQSISVHGTERKAWILILLREPDTAEGHSFDAAKFQYLVDCVGRRTMIVAGAQFDRNMQLVEDIDLLGADWSPVYPESDQDRAVRLICEGSNPQGVPLLRASSFRALAKKFWDEPERHFHAGA